MTVKPLVRNRKKVAARDLVSLAGLFAPALAFAGGLTFLSLTRPYFAMFQHVSAWPWELWALGICGTIATAGGLADWLFHRTFVTVGPAEHRSHLLALLTGGVPLFVLMAWASLVPSARGSVLLPIVVVVIYTTVLICYDEFAFHRHRCRAIETLYHRLLTLGNGCAWLAWLHWAFVRGGVGA